MIMAQAASLLELGLLLSSAAFDEVEGTYGGLSFGYELELEFSSNP